MFYVSSHDKKEVSGRYTKDKDKGIKAYHYKNPINDKGRQQERKKRTTKLSENN